MTLSSRWKSALVGIIGHDTIHNSFAQDLPQAPGGILGVTQGFVKEQTYKAPWEKTWLMLLGAIVQGP